MSRLLCVSFVLSLLLALGFLQIGSIPEVRASSSIYQGNLILTGNNVTTIEGRFDINGSIIVEDNATLILHNAVLNFTQSAIYEHNMTLRNAANGNPRLQASDSKITSNLEYFLVELYDNSSATISNSTDTSYLRLFDSAVASVSNSSIELFEMYSSTVASFFNSTFGSRAFAQYSSTLTVSNSTIHLLDIGSASVNCSFVNVRPGFFNYWDYQSNSSLLIGSGGAAANVTLSNTMIDNWELEFDGASNVTIKDSTLSDLNSYYSSTVWLVNTTVATTHFFMQSKIYVSWYLNAHVIGSVGQDVPSANVTAFYSNSTLADSKLTDTSGRATLTLMEKIMNNTGSYAVGNYTVQASYLTYSNYTTINVTQNQEITLALSNLYVPEFPSFLFLPLFMIITLLAVIVYRRKHSSKAISV